MNVIEIEEVLVKAINQVVGIKIEDRSKNLFGNEYRITPRDMVYVVATIEKQLEQEITVIFQTEDINLMTVNNLAKAIYMRSFNNMKHI